MRSPRPSHLTIRLDGDLFLPSVGLDSAETRAVLASIRSQQSSPRGWNALVLPSLNYSCLSRADEHTVVVRLPLSSDYTVPSPETLAVSLPAATLASDAAVASADVIVIVEDQPEASLDVRVVSQLIPPLGGVDEAALRSNATYQINITLLHTYGGARSHWPPVFRTQDPWAKELLMGIAPIAKSGREKELGGWVANSGAALTIELATEHLVVIHVAPMPNYDIAAPEAVAIRVPSWAYCNPVLCDICPCTNVVNGKHVQPELRAALDIYVYAEAAACTLGGSLVPTASSEALRSGRLEEVAAAVTRVYHEETQ